MLEWSTLWLQGKWLNTDTYLSKVPHGNARVCVRRRVHYIRVQFCVSARTCLWKGQMGKREEQSQIKTDDSTEKRKRRRGEMGIEGTWSGNASVPLRPATLYHGASTDRWMQESLIIEMLRNKCPDEREELLHVSRCVRMARGRQGSAAVWMIATHLSSWHKHGTPNKDVYAA